MKHPKQENWSDYVRGTTDPGLAETLAEHLGTGCVKCAREVSALQSVLRVAQIDREFEVPVSALRGARNLFKVQQLLERQRASRPSLELSFDSLLATSVGGTRSGVAQDRHMVFASSEMTVDVQIGAGDGSNSLRVAGQILDANSSPIAELPAFLCQRGRISSQDLSGGMGQFSLDGEMTGSPRLCFLVGDDRLVDLQLPVLGTWE